MLHDRKRNFTLSWCDRKVHRVHYFVLVRQKSTLSLLLCLVLYLYGLASELTVSQMGKVEHHNCESGSKLSFNRGLNKFFTCWCSLHIS